MASKKIEQMEAELKQRKAAQEQMLKELTIQASEGIKAGKEEVKQVSNKMKEIIRVMHKTVERSEAAKSRALDKKNLNQV